MTKQALIIYTIFENVVKSKGKQIKPRMYHNRKPKTQLHTVKRPKLEFNHDFPTI